MKKTFFILFALQLISCSPKQYNEVEPNINNDQAYDEIISEVYQYSKEMSVFYFDYYSQIGKTCTNFDLPAMKPLKEAIDLCNICYDHLVKVSTKIISGETVDLIMWQKEYNKNKRVYNSFIYSNLKNPDLSPSDYKNRKSEFIKTSNLYHLIDLEDQPINNCLSIIENEKINISILLLMSKEFLFFFDKYDV